MKKSNHPTPQSRYEAGDNNLSRRNERIKERYKSNEKKRKKFNNEGNARAPGIAPVKRTKTQHKSRCEKNNEKKIPQREKRGKKKDTKLEWMVKLS